MFSYFQYLPNLLTATENLSQNVMFYFFLYKEIHLVEFCQSVIPAIVRYLHTYEFIIIWTQFKFHWTHLVSFSLFSYLRTEQTQLCRYFWVLFFIYFFSIYVYCCVGTHVFLFDTVCCDAHDCLQVLRSPSYGDCFLKQFVWGFYLTMVYRLL